MAVTLLNVRTRIRQRTDNEHPDGDRITDTELNQLVNMKYKALYGLLIRHGLHRSETTYSIVATGAANYALPTDLWAVLGVFRVDSAQTDKVWMHRHDHRLRPGTSNVGDADTYRVIGPNIEFYPLPSSGTYEVVYAPVPLELAADTDELDGVLGWDEYVVLACSIDVHMKEGSLAEAQLLKQDLAIIEQRIVDEAKASELSENPSVQNVRGYGVRLPGAFNVVGYRGSFRGYW